MQTETGPKTLTHLVELNQVFGMAILSGGGRVESNLTFSGSNLGIFIHCMLCCTVLHFYRCSVSNYG